MSAIEKKILRDKLQSILLEVELAQPELPWDNSYITFTDTLKIVIREVDLDISGKSKFDYGNIFFSYFNGKSPCGEIFEYLQMTMPKVRELSYEVSDAITNLLQRN